jgi:hypothetical protein
MKGLKKTTENSVNIADVPAKIRTGDLRIQVWRVLLDHLFDISLKIKVQLRNSMKPQSQGIFIGFPQFRQASTVVVRYFIHTITASIHIISSSSINRRFRDNVVEKV